MRRVFLAAVTAMLVAGCVDRTSSDIMAAARQHLAKGDTAAAAIELRTLLQRKPQAAEARFLLGKLAYEAGEMHSAEDQLRLSIQYGYPDEEAIPLLATVLAAMNRSMALLQEFGQTEFADHEATVLLKLQVAAAYMFDGKFDEANKVVGRALQLVPDHADAAALRARLTAIAGDADSARQQVEKLLARAPNNAAAWALKGDLLMNARPQNVDAAIEAHRVAVRERPNLVQSHAAILSMLVARGDIESAATQWAALNKALPKHPQTSFFEAVIALNRGELEKARQISQAMLVTSPHDLRLLMVAGEAELRLNSLEQAEALLTKAVKYAQAAVPPRHLLAEVYVRNGRAEDALEILQPLLKPQVGDAFALTLAGRAHLIAGDAAAANASFAKAVKIKPDDKRVRMAAALGQLSLGHSPGAAFAELELIARSSTDSAADLALVSVRLERKEFDPALKALDALAAKIPNQALPDHLRGRIQLAKGNVADARARFEAALGKQPDYFPAVANLVALDVADGKLAAARSRLEEIRQREPENVQARLALAKFTLQTGGTREEAARLIEEAIKAKPTDATAHLALVDHNLVSRNPDRALAVAQNAVSTLPDNLLLLDALGRVNLARKDLEQAIAVFNKMSLKWPRSSLPYTRLAEAYLAKKRPAAAAENAVLALKEAPRSLEAQRTAVVAALRLKRPAQALAIARKVQEQRPKETTGFIMEGDIEMAVRNYPAAATAFRKAVAKSATTEAAKRLHLALVGAGNAAETQRWADTWRAEHPADTEFLVHLADVSLTRGELERAEALYREVLQRLPNNPFALSNVAYMLVKQNKTGALPLAERAAQLAPGSANVLDTLAAAYAADNQLAKAVEWQSKALQLSPNAGVLRLNLAKLHIQANDREKAVAELDRLAVLGKSFSGYSEVAQLRKKLGP